MRGITKRTAAVAIAIAGFALIGSACTHTKEPAQSGGSAGTAARSSTTASAATTPNSKATSTASSTATSAGPTTTMTGANGTAYPVSGPILEKYNSLAEKAKKDLGAPIHEQVTNTDGGVFQPFDGGVIISGKPGTFVVWGKIRDAWNALGGSQGKLGYPTTDEIDTPDGNKESKFEHGTITWKTGDEKATVAYN